MGTSLISTFHRLPAPFSLSHATASYLFFPLETAAGYYQLFLRLYVFISQIYRCRSDADRKKMTIENITRAAEL